MKKKNNENNNTELHMMRNAKLFRKIFSWKYVEHPFEKVFVENDE